MNKKMKDEIQTPSKFGSIVKVLRGSTQVAAGPVLEPLP